MTDSSDCDSSSAASENSCSPNLTSCKETVPLSEPRYCFLPPHAAKTSDDEPSIVFEQSLGLQLGPKESMLVMNVDRELQLMDVIEKQKEQIKEYHNTILRLETSNSCLESTFKDLETKYDTACKQKELAVKEKETMVIKYAMSEKGVIKQQTAKEAAERKVKELQREQDLLQHKLTMMNNEKARICQMLDNKNYELKTSQQDAERSKLDISALETKLKWTQNNFKSEMEMRKDFESKLEALQAQVQNYVDETEKAKKDAEYAIKEFHTSQENRAYVLENQGKEQQASLILLRHELDDREGQLKTLQAELDKLQKKQNDHIIENNSLSKKVQKLETERNELEVKLTDLRNSLDDQQQSAAELIEKSTQLEQLKLQLHNEQDLLQASKNQNNLLRLRNTDLSGDIEACRAHETELLAFTQQLTDKNVILQSEFTSLETKVQQLTYENGVLTRKVQDQETKSNMSLAQMHAERKKLLANVEQLGHELKLVQKDLQTTAQELADQQGENNVLKRKHELSLREVTRELAHVRKKLEQNENKSSMASSSSSTSSLNNVEANGNVTPPPSTKQPLDLERVKVIQPEMPLDRHVLIEHIAKLQRISAKKSEKLDFMEEHVRTLVGELQKKSRLLQHYIKREQQGALSSDQMDHNKADLAKQSGLMASMYGAKIADEHLSIEQVLEINRKLYSILEDALLKNMTLKDNIDTLGAEIDKLRKFKP